MFLSFLNWYNIQYFFYEKILFFVIVYVLKLKVYLNMSLFKKFLMSPFNGSFLSQSVKVISSTFATQSSIDKANLFTKNSSLVLNDESNIWPSNNLNMQQIRTYKCKTRLRKRCKSCYFVWRNGRIYVECNEHPRHKQHHVSSLIRGFDNIPHGYTTEKAA